MLTGPGAAIMHWPNMRSSVVVAAIQGFGAAGRLGAPNTSKTASSASELGPRLRQIEPVALNAPALPTKLAMNCKQAAWSQLR